MKIEKRGNSYRVRKTIDGKTYTRSFDHKPTIREAEASFRDVTDRLNGKISFETAAISTIESKENVLSPSSVRKYNAMVKQFSEDFLDKRIDDITNQVVQAEINRIASTRSTKTVKDYYSFITSVFGLFRPEITLKVKLPTKDNKKPIYVPSEAEIRSILEETKGTDFEVPIMLGCYGMRRGEVCALTMDDIEGNVIHITKTMVLNKSTEWEVVAPKTTESIRDIYVPDQVIDAMNENGLYTGHPNSLNKHLHRVQKKLGITEFSFHKLRHFFCSEAHANGIPDADIMKFGGWKTDNVMKAIYRHSTNSPEKVSRSINIF